MRDKKEEKDYDKRIMEELEQEYISSCLDYDDTKFDDDGNLIEEN